MEAILIMEGRARIIVGYLNGNWANIQYETLGATSMSDISRLCRDLDVQNISWGSKTSNEYWLLEV